MKKALFTVVAMSITSATSAPFVWPAAWTGEPNTANKRGGEFRSYTISDYKTMNPFTTAEADSLTDLMTLRTSGLFTQDPRTDEFIPYMAEGKPTVSNGNKRFVVKIRKGMKFTDGQEITADDWVTTATIHKDDKVGSNSRDTFFINDKPITVKKLDTYTLQFDFPQVSAGAYSRMTYAPWPDHVFGKTYRSGGAAAIKKMWTLGTPTNEIVSPGAWTLDTYQAGERAVLKKNTYWGEWNKDSKGNALPYLDRYSSRITADLNAALAAYLAGLFYTFGPSTAV